MKNKDDPKGTPIIIVREENFKMLLNMEVQDNRIAISKISEEDIMKSQRSSLELKKCDITKKKNLLTNQSLSNMLY